MSPIAAARRRLCEPRSGEDTAAWSDPAVGWTGLVGKTLKLLLLLFPKVLVFAWGTDVGLGLKWPLGLDFVKRAVL